MRAVLLLTVALVAAGTAMAALSPPARVTLDGVAGARPGMSVAALSAVWGVRVRPSYEVRSTCGTARIDLRIEGQVIFAARSIRGGLFPGGRRHRQRDPDRIDPRAAAACVPEARLQAGQVPPRRPQLLCAPGKCHTRELRFDVSAARGNADRFGERTAVRLVKAARRLVYSDSCRWADGGMTAAWRAGRRLTASSASASASLGRRSIVSARP